MMTQFISFEVFESERLIIRVPRPGDGLIFNEAVVESLQTLRPWLAWAAVPPTLEESEFSCRQAYAKFLLGEDLRVFFISKDDGVLVGGSGLHNPNWDLKQFEVGYWGRSRYSKKGLITEGVKALVDHAFEKLDASRVYLTTDDANTESWRLAARAGFELEGTMRKDRLNLAGSLRDTRLYARVNSTHTVLKT
ncbi:RimJ/RimL family protein N-acetyltransferase [Prosthecobacter fusiformis]|uniref:RimJ/RimL family protein N-acetyltransferase n=1 Tax=Prosthecobacter fusiformis TaxID=48464 RepID=A0A4R7RUE6_9BACT|nr:GNAT family protein [Prosthecobacter fusiformis]TDU68057.1 RimJ/RimL family protein N-acetyltransferase [Prosthecobacter fusiformis]